MKRTAVQLFVFLFLTGCVTMMTTQSVEVDQRTRTYSKDFNHIIRIYATELWYWNMDAS